MVGDGLRFTLGDVLVAFEQAWFRVRFFTCGHVVFYSEAVLNVHRCSQDGQIKCNGF